jgi:hypothetical protein
VDGDPSPSAVPPRRSKNTKGAVEMNVRSIAEGAYRGPGAGGTDLKEEVDGSLWSDSAEMTFPWSVRRWEVPAAGHFAWLTKQLHGNL